MIVVGAPNSSNSQRLREVAERAGCARPTAAARARHRLADVQGIATLAITAGASRPEVLVEEVIDAFSQRFTVEVESVRTADETISFNLPRQLRADAAE